MVGDLEEIDARQAAPHDDRVDALPDVAREEEAPPVRLPEEDDRDVVHPRPVVRRIDRDRPAVRPEDTEADLVEPERVAREEPFRAEAPGRERCLPGGIPGSAAGHPGLGNAPDCIPFEEEREARHVVLVGVGQHDKIEPPVPRREPRVERHQEAVRIRTAVDEEAAAPPRLHEDRIPLADVEDDDVRPPVRPGRGGDEERPEGEGDREGDEPRCPRASGVGACPPVRGRRGRVACATGGSRSRGRSRRGSRRGGAPALAGPVPARHSSPRPASPRPDPAEPSFDRGPDATAGGEGNEPACREPCRGGIEGRPQDEAREREAGPDPDDEHDGVEEKRSGQPEQGRERRRRAEARQRSADERDEPAGHRRRDERHDREIEEWGQGREPPELEEDDRERRGLGRQRDGESLDEPAREPRSPVAQALADGRRPGEEPGRGRGRQAEARVQDGCRGCEEDERDGPAQRRCRGPGPAGRPRDEGDGGHHRGADHRRRRPREDRVADDGDEDAGRPRATAATGEQAADGGRDERDVPAGDGDDVAEAGRCEVGGEIAVDPLAEADEDSGRQPGRRLGE